MTLLYLKQYGNVFEVRVLSDVAVNAWQGRVILPPNVGVKAVVYGDSIGDVWQNPPSLSALGIDFSGGRTAGFTGEGLLFRFTAFPKDSTHSPYAELIRFDGEQTAVYQANGQGTLAKTTLQPITINTKDLVGATSSTPFVATNVPPEPFGISIVRERDIFDGKRAVIFSTTDVDVGVDHYEVQEYGPQGSIGWHTAVSPYLVDPETTRISIRAVDRNGNARTESIVLQANFSGARVVAIIGVLVMLAIATAYVIRKWQRKHSR